MRVLWFTSTSSRYEKAKANHAYNGCGWIASLEEAVCMHTDITLGIAFFHQVDDQPLHDGQVTYYPMREYPMNKWKNFMDKYKPLPEKEEYELKKMRQVIDDFNPDIIHVFGTEYIFASICEKVKTPIVIHLQGLLAPYHNAYYPININKWSVWTYFKDFKSILSNNSLERRRKIMCREGLREIKYFQNIPYFMGRTAWDFEVSHFLSKGKAKYFKVDEVLREPFYESAGKWSKNHSGKIVIVSTISETIYKGLDLILKTADLLKRYGCLNFEWHVIGVKSSTKMLRLYEKAAEVKAKGLPLVFEGVKSPQEIIQLLCEASVYVHPSYIDNSPNSLCEAQLVGIPVIATHVGGVSSLIAHKETGILVPANAPYELAYWIQEIHTHDKLSSMLSEHGMNIAKERHAILNIIRQLNQCYAEIL